MRVRPRDGREHRSVADVEILQAVDAEVVTHDVAARPDRVEICAEPFIDRPADRPTELLYRRVLGQLPGKLERPLQRLAVTVVGQQAVTDRLEVNATA